MPQITKRIERPPLAEALPVSIGFDRTAVFSRASATIKHKKTVNPQFDLSVGEAARNCKTRFSVHCKMGLANLLEPCHLHIEGVRAL